MLDAQMFSWFINTFHINGISTLLSRFVYRYQGVEYRDFYAELYDFIQQDPWLRKEQDEVFHYFHSWMRHGKINHPNIGIEIHGWNIIHRTVLNLHAERQYDNIFAMLGQFMARYDLSPDLLSSLMRFQRRYLVAHEDMNSYPERLTLDYNIWEYLTFGQDLEQRESSYLLDFPEDKSMTLGRFLELIYFARRRNFGKTTVERLDDEAAKIDVARRGAASARATASNASAAVET
jgi:hypothetical protein